MADDRIFIKCNFCDGWKMLLKYYQYCGATTRDNSILEWLDSHALCRDNHPMELDQPGFSLHVEKDLWCVLKAENQNKEGENRWITRPREPSFEAWYLVYSPVYGIDVIEWRDGYFQSKYGQENITHWMELPEPPEAYDEMDG